MIINRKSFHYRFVKRFNKDFSEERYDSFPLYVWALVDTIKDLIIVSVASAVSIFVGCMFFGSLFCEPFEGLENHKSTLWILVKEGFLPCFIFITIVMLFQKNKGRFQRFLNKYLDSINS